MMKTVNEVSRLTGVSIRTLQYYDKIGLLHPAGYTEAGYRLYDDTDLEKLQQILMFKELEFPLKDIARIIKSPDFDREKAIRQQIKLLTLKKEHLEKLIDLARGIKITGGNEIMDFSAFDTKQLDEYTAKAKAEWGDTASYREYEKKSGSRSKETEIELGKKMMDIFREFGEIRSSSPDSAAARGLVKRLQEYITDNYYNCTCEILSSLGKMYVSGNDFTKNIDAAGGEGTAEFVYKAIVTYCR
jgi:DNA-binding transcriptional MerR regulator